MHTSAELVPVHSTSRSLPRTFRVVLILALATPYCGYGLQLQTSPPSPADTSQAAEGTLQTSHAPLTPEQAQLQADTEKLDRMVRELQAEIAKSDQTTLSLSLVKKTDEIEKLARSLKKKLRPK